MASETGQEIGLLPVNATALQKKKRSRFGCNTCRARKVKCDERPNGCSNCERLHIECSGYSRQHAVPKNVRSKRTYRSCEGCRVARIKCSGDRPCCKACQNNEVQCSYSKETRQGQSNLSRKTGFFPESSQSVSDHTTEPATTPWQTPFMGQGTGNDSPEAQLAWLNVPSLPEAKRVRLLVNHYFQNFQPGRCFAFIHIPTFLRHLDDVLGSSLQENALLHIICALGAQFYAVEYSDTVISLPTPTVRSSGSLWAKTALRQLFDSMDTICVESLMAAQLLYDYALRMANFTQAFMLSAMMTRMTQALQINLEYSADLLDQSSCTALSATVRESRRRLMWSCYVTDALCGSGVEQLTMLQKKDMKIQLPCNEWSFLHEVPRITRTIQGPALDFLPPETIPPDPDVNIGIMGYFVHQIELRKRVLQYIKRLDTAKLPWLPDSEFAELDHELRNWHDSLPATLQFTAPTIYMREQSSQLGALCVFHCAYHQTMCDFYRIGTPELFKLRFAFDFPADKAHFRAQLQWNLFKEARTLAAIIAEGRRHGPRIIGDSWLPTIAYDSNRTMLFYLTQATDQFGLNKKDLIMSTIPYLQSNVQALDAMRATNAVADGLATAAKQMLDRLEIGSNNILPLPNVILDDPYLAALGRNEDSAPGTPPQSAPDYVLNPLSIYRMARQGIPEGHAPEHTTPRLTRGSSRASAATRQLSATNTRDELRYVDLQGNSEQGDLNLDMFFAPDLAFDWQPAEMIVGSDVGGHGMLQWIETSQPADFFTDPQA